jgi:hypothetical protein
MTIDGNILDDFESVLDMKVDSNRPGSSKTVGTVSRIDKDGSVWVRLAGASTDTPCRTVTVASKPGDTVEVEVGGGSARITGNVTSPSTDDSTAETAISHASRAMGDATRAYEAANEAQTSADAAAVAAVDAQTSANNAATAASNAQTSANNAATAAANAQTSANTANTAANDALTQLGIVEQVVDVLSWISEHATYKASTDTEVVAGKFYFTRSGSGTAQNPYVYTYVVSPTGNPSTNHYYEIDSIDEAVSNYISAHLALTDDGLYVVKDNNGYKVLLSNAGMSVYDPQGGIVGSYGANVSIGRETETHIAITPTELALKDSAGQSIAYIAADEGGLSTLFTTRVFATEGITFGSWRWFENSDGNLTLQWIGDANV